VCTRTLRSAFTATGLIKFPLNKTAFVHRHKWQDCAVIILIFNWLQQNVHDGVVKPQLLFMATVPVLSEKLRIVEISFDPVNFAQTSV
jgi:hypothetical protein